MAGRRRVLGFGERGRFLRALAETGEVRAAARIARLPEHWLYRLRRYEPAFAAEWDAALAAGKAARVVAERGRGVTQRKRVTRRQWTPADAARAVAAAAEAHGADRVVAEANQGGEMVKSMLRAAGITLPVTMASASRSKSARAEPVSGLFECGKAKLAGRFPELEAELGGMVPGKDYSGPGRSPDRADAMVWALWALLIAPGAEPKVRAL